MPHLLELYILFVNLPHVKKYKVKKFEVIEV